MAIPNFNKQNINYSNIITPELKLAIVKAEFNSKITDLLLKGAEELLISQGIVKEQIMVFQVPGAFEIPSLCERLCQNKSADGIITLGAVIRGETSHYDYVCSESARGIMNVGLKYSIPVSFGILTCENETQALDRAGGKYGNKGEDSAITVLEMLKIYKDL